MCSLSVMSDLDKFKKVTLHYSVRAALPNSTAASILLPLFSPHNCCTVSPPLPLHFVAMVTLTLNSQVCRCWGRYAQAVARTAGVFPGILRLDPEDDKGAVDENAHPQLQITARRHRRFVTHSNTPTWQCGLLFFFIFFFWWITSRCHKRAAESQTVVQFLEWSKNHITEQEILINLLIAIISKWCSLHYIPLTPFKIKHSNDGAAVLFYTVK